MRTQPAFVAPSSVSTRLAARPAVSRHSNWIKPAPYNPRIKAANDIRASLHMNMSYNDKQPKRLENIGKNLKSGVLAGVVAAGLMTS